VAIPGYLTTVKVTGTTTAMTDEAMSLVSGKTYRITNAAKRVIDASYGTLTVKDNGVTINPSSSPYTVDFLLGKVTLNAGYTVNGAITITGKYLPLLPVLFCRSASFKRIFDALDDTAFDHAGEQHFVGGEKHAEGELEVLENLGTDLDSGGDTVTWAALHDNRTMKVIDIELNSSAKVARAWALFPSLDEEAPAKDLVKRRISWKSASQIPAVSALASQVSQYSVG
jgi:hypothetical protein